MGKFEKRQKQFKTELAAAMDIAKELALRNREQPLFCRIYKCEKRSANITGYCVDHCSELRNGLPSLMTGSAPVLSRKAK